MTAPCSHSRSPWTYRTPARDAHVRIGDAERSETADRLSKHFGEGRLDESEFNERLEQAMHAKTRADLDGLFHDLPPEGGTPVRTAQRSHRPHRLLFFVLVAIAVVASTSYVVSHIPWLLVGLVVFLVLRHRHVHHRHD